MIRIVLVISAICACLTAHAGQLTVEIDAEDVSFTYTVLNQTLTQADVSSGNRKSAVSCSVLYYGRLSAGYIKAASALSTQPDQTEKTWKEYEARVGADSFQQSMKDYFTSGNVIHVEAVKGDSHMLVIRTPDYVAAQFYLKTEGGFLVDEDRVSADAKALGKLFPMIRDGEVELK